MQKSAKDISQELRARLEKRNQEHSIKFNRKAKEIELKFMANIESIVSNKQEQK